MCSVRLFAILKSKIYYINFYRFIYRTPGVDIINPIQSARLVTKDSFSFRYGTIEVRAKMPKGDWIWPGK